MEESAAAKIEPDASISLVKFITMEECPLEWQRCDLYLFHDNRVVFYVGQSKCAYARVWEHIHGGFKGTSLVGLFALRNWPCSMHFEIELLSSKSAQFCSLGNDLNAAERALIERFAPCFNDMLNAHPTPLPEKYISPHVNVRRLRSLHRMHVEASYALRAENNRRSWEG